ncbi:MAG: hypothetical protein OIN85_00650 [Candidatus Methanoperedens sp.]|nr:hypothetical protein [Candidatus Methanoperedens sp.]
MNDNHSLVIPAFGKSRELSLHMQKIREAEVRYIEAKTVNPSTYADLEHSFNEAYRDLKQHLSSIGYQLTLAEKALKEAKANVILGTYADHMKDKPKYQDNSDLREAFLMRDADYLAATDRINQLKALQSNFDGKVKVVENVCRYMRQKMYLLSKSGVPYEAIGVTSGRKNDGE